MEDDIDFTSGIYLPRDLALNVEQVGWAEQAIRDMAGNVCAQVATRKSHPSYGYTKSAIRAMLSSMEGAIGLYMIQTGQAMHSAVPMLAKFADPMTKERVETARRLVTEL